MIILEGNHIENCAYGIYLRDNVYGILLKNNSFDGIGVDADFPEGTVFPNGLATEDVTVGGAPLEYHTVSSYTFYVDGEIVSEYSKAYTNREALPELEDSHFLGWAKTETVEDKSQLVTVCDGTDCNLYAIFGCNIVLDWNYDNKGVYREYTELEGAEMPRLGNPVRIDYEFGGWYTDAACTQEFTGTTVTGDIRLYAKWISENAEIPPDNSQSSDEGGGCGSSVVWVVLPALIALSGAITFFGLGKKKDSR